MERTALREGLAESFPSPAYDQIYFPKCFLTEDEFWFKWIHFIFIYLFIGESTECFWE